MSIFKDPHGDLHYTDESGRIYKIVRVNKTPEQEEVEHINFESQYDRGVLDND